MNLDVGGATTSESPFDIANPHTAVAKMSSPTKKAAKSQSSRKTAYNSVRKD
jgi:hypothetical protein